MANSRKKCKQCGEYQIAETMLDHPIGAFCNDECQMAWIRATQEKARTKRQARVKRDSKIKDKISRAKHRADLKRIRKTPRAVALEVAQLLSRVSSADDDGYCVCRSCGAVKRWNEMDGGHFIAKGDSSYWALDQRNIWPQCKPCNGFGMKHGTAAISYTNWMVAKFGQKFVDMMIASKKTKAKRSVAFYSEFIKATKQEIKANKLRMGIK